MSNDMITIPIISSGSVKPSSVRKRAGQSMWHGRLVA
jgi:hypothetical protein